MKSTLARTGTALTFGTMMFASAAIAGTPALQADTYYQEKYETADDLLPPFQRTEHDSGSSFAFVSHYEAHGSGYAASAANGILGAQAVVGSYSNPGEPVPMGNFNVFSLDAEIDNGGPIPTSVQMLSNARWEATFTNDTGQAVDYTFLFHVYGPSLQTDFNSGKASVSLQILSDRNPDIYSASINLSGTTIEADPVFQLVDYNDWTNFYHFADFDASVSIGTIAAGESFTLTYLMDAYAFTADVAQEAYAYIGDPFGMGGPDYQMIPRVVPGDPAPGIPEPASWALMIAGFGLVGGAMRRRRHVAIA